MDRLQIGDRVIVVSAWSTLRGIKGVVTQTRPKVLVRLDDDPREVALWESELARLPNAIAGAE